jgi:hypothetical protein
VTPGARSRLIVFGLVAAVSATACAAKYQKVEDSFSEPINCSTARADIQDLHAEKVDKGTEAAMGLKFALPTTIIVGAITGTGGAESDVGTGDYNRKIDQRIANIKSTCNIQ